MAVMDEFKKEREHLKHGTFKEKLNYFWYYYKFHTIITVICLVIIGFFIYNAVTKKEYVFNTAFVNAGSVTDTREFTELTAEALNIDTEKCALDLDNSMFIDPDNPNDEATYYSIQKLSALLMTYDVDTTIMNSETHRSYAYTGIYADLREILNPEQLEKYSPYFFYIDNSVCKKISDLQEEGKFYEKEFPDPKAPEKMKDPVPVGIFIEDARLLNRYYIFEPDSVLGIPNGTKHLDYALAFLDFAFSENKF